MQYEHGGLIMFHKSVPPFKYILLNGHNVAIYDDTITFEIKLKFEYLSPTYQQRLFFFNDADKSTENTNSTIFQLQQALLLKQQPSLKALKPNELFISFIKIEIKENEIFKLISLCQFFESREFSIELSEIINIRTKHDESATAIKIDSAILLELFNNHIKFSFEHEDFNPCVPLFQSTKKIFDTENVDITKKRNAELKITSISFSHRNRNNAILEFSKKDLKKYLKSNHEIDEKPNIKQNLIDKKEGASKICCSIM